MTDKQPEHETWNRWQCLEFLLETTSQHFQDNLLDKIVASMSDNQFAETYEFICRSEGLARNYDELNELVESDSVFEPELD
jgi:hypothetical protein